MHRHRWQQKNIVDIAKQIALGAALAPIRAAAFLFHTPARWAAAGARALARRARAAGRGVLGGARLVRRAAAPAGRKLAGVVAVATALIAIMAVLVADLMGDHKHRALAGGAAALLAFAVVMASAPVQPAPAQATNAGGRTEDVLALGIAADAAQPSSSSSEPSPEAIPPEALKQAVPVEVDRNGNAFPPDAPACTLSEAQCANARTIVAVGKEMNVPQQGIVVALSTAMQESNLRMLANDGSDARLGADQRDVAKSLQYPNDGVGRDHGSVNFMQQQYPWWGTLDELMDPATAARKFYERLLQVNGWEQLPVTVAAQRVQRSAFPQAYADDEPRARDLLGQLFDAVGSFVPLPSPEQPNPDAIIQPLP